MTDRIEKIVSKWGFGSITLANRDEVEVQYFRYYRGFKFYIIVFNDNHPYTKIELGCRAKSEDSNVASMRFEIGKTLYYARDDRYIEFMLKDKIKQFLDEFFAYDLFHDKDWKDGKQV